MKLEATIQIRNEHMVKARQEKQLTQKQVAIMAGVSMGLISCLERLQYPAQYRSMDVTMIADVLDLLPEQVMPLRMAGWRGRTKFTCVEDVSIDHLLKYRETMAGHYILPSPSEIAEKHEVQEQMIALLGKLDDARREVIVLRYRLDRKAARPLTLREIATKLGKSQQRIAQLERTAIRYLESAMHSNEVLTLLEEIEIHNEQAPTALARG